MCKLIYYVLLIFLGYPQSCMVQECPEQKSLTGPQNNIEIIWRAHQAQNKPSSVQSVPICLDSKKNIVERICTSNGQWKPADPPSCTYTQATRELQCLPTHQQYQDLCVSISQPQPWTDNAPVPETLNITSYLQILRDFNITKAWLPVKRTEPFGKLVWMNPNNWYQKYKHPLLKDSFKIGSPIYDCLIISKIDENGLSYIPKLTDCKSKYPSVHIYTKRQTYMAATKKYIYSLNGSSFYQIKGPIRGQVNKNICNDVGSVFKPVDINAMQRLIELIYHSQWELNEQIKWFHGASMIDTEYYWHPENNSLTLTVSSLISPNMDRRSSIVCEGDTNDEIIDLTLNLNKKKTALVLTVYGLEHFLNLICRVSGLDDLKLGIDWDDPVIHDDNRRVYLLNPSTPPGYNYYRCMGLIIKNGELKKISTKYVLFDTEIYDNKYAFDVVIHRFCKLHICDPYISDFYQDIQKKIVRKVKHSIIKLENLQAKKVLSVKNNNGDLKLLFNLALPNRNLLSKLKELIESAIDGSFKGTKAKVNSFRSITECMANVTKSGGRILHWERSPVGATVMPKEPCFQANGVPVTRTCMGNHLYGAQWSLIQGECYEKDSAPVYNHLYEIYTNRSEITASDAIQGISNITTNNTQLQPADIFYLTQILVNVTTSNEVYENTSVLSTQLLATVSNLMDTNVSAIETANHELISTNLLLGTSEQLLEQFAQNEMNDEGLFRIIEPKSLYQISDPFKAGVTGVALYKPFDEATFNEYKIISLYANASLEDLSVDKSLEIAAFVPQELLNDIKNVGTNFSVRISIQIFYNDYLFVGNTKESDASVISKVLSISISGYETYLRYPVRVFVKPSTKISEEGLDKECGYWDFGSVAESITYPSQWRVDPDIQTNTANTSENYKICEFLHLTHFALLVGVPRQYFSLPSEPIPEDIQIEPAFYVDNTLDIITSVGCALSVFGIGVIMTTACVFKSWRRELKRKILLNIALCILLQIIVLYVADKDNFEKGDTECIVLGSLLHYLVLCSFAWSTVTVYQQYLRFVRVLGAQPTHMLLKTCLVGWLAPCVPVGSALLLDLHGYVPAKQGLCYPQGVALYATVFVPVGVIVLANFIMLCFILHSISKSSKQLTTAHRNVGSTQAKLAVLLFFMFGLTWIFGLLAATRKCTACLYLFCATATLQGFVLFVFTVILDNQTRRLWAELCKCKPKWRSAKPTSSEAGVRQQTLAISLEDLTGEEARHTRHAQLMQEMAGKQTHRNGGPVVVRRTH